MNKINNGLYSTGKFFEEKISPVAEIIGAGASAVALGASACAVALAPTIAGGAACGTVATVATGVGIIASAVTFVPTIFKFAGNRFEMSEATSTIIDAGSMLIPNVGPVDLGSAMGLSNYLTGGYEAIGQLTEYAVNGNSRQMQSGSPMGYSSHKPIKDSSSGR